MSWRPLLLVSVLSACGESSLKGADASLDGDSGGHSAHTASFTTPADPVVTWRHYDATLSLVGGVPDPVESTVTMTLHSETADALCTVSLPVLAVTDSPRPQRSMLAWWGFELGEGTTSDPDACPSWPEGPVWLGVGPYDTALDPARVAAGFEGATASAGLVGFAEDGPVWLAGLAGDQAQLRGAEAPPTERPLPDGVLKWIGLYVLPL